MSTIWFLGDIHGSFGHVFQAVEAAPALPRAVIFLGDIEPCRPFDDEIAPLLARGIDVFWIRGNHDTDTEAGWRCLTTPTTMARNIDGRVVAIGGVRVAGLGGIFRGDIWYPRCSANAREHPASFDSFEDFRRDLHERQGLTRRLLKRGVDQGEAIPASLLALADTTMNGKLRKHQSSIFPDTVSTLAAMRADVLVTHEAPGCNRLGFAALDELATAMGVGKLFHGHHHITQAYPQMAPKVVSVGYRAIVDLDGRLVWDGGRPSR